MSEPTVPELTFSRRKLKDKYQVRFWSTPERYEAFRAAVEKEGLVIQDVLNTLMNWFVEQSKVGKLQIQGEEWRQYHGCRTGDCPHERQEQCDEDLRQEGEETAMDKLRKAQGENISYEAEPSE